MATKIVNKSNVLCGIVNNIQVQGTNDCSIVSKHSCATKGYVDDVYLKAFISKPQHRSPIINRGYYIRYKAINAAFKSFWETVHLISSDKFQIVSLGAGFDTSYFRLKANKMFLPGSRYVEVDFPEVMNRKLSCILSNPDLKSFIGNTETSSAVKHSQIIFSSSDYILLGVNLDDIHNLQHVMNIIGIDYTIPTMFLSECAITYMDVEKSSVLVKWAQQMFPNSAFIAYEQVYPSDGFGCIMQNHFMSIGSPLKSVLSYPNIDAQEDRYRNEGWESSTVIGINDLYSSFSFEEKQRVQEIELFDEYEMWHQKCSHYVLICASQGEALHINNFLKIPGISPKSEHCLRYKGVICWEKSGASCTLERYGHQSVLLSSDSILVSGGFGHRQGKHQRLGGLILFKCQLDRSVEVNVLDPKDILGKRMHHTLTRLCDDKLIVFGGRTSPAKACEEVVLISPRKSLVTESENPSDIEMNSRCGAKNVNFMTHQNETPSDFHLKSRCAAFVEKESQNPNCSSHYTCEQIHLVGSEIGSRWRHSAVNVSHEAIEKLVIFGGCSTNRKALNDCYIINSNTWTCLEVPITDKTPCSRHSHSSSAYRSQHVVISGGLTADEHVLDSVHVLDLTTLKWVTWPVVGLIPRYSHTSHIWEDNLILIGGVNTFPNSLPGLSVINLTTFHAKEYRLPDQDPEYPILLNNHTSCLKGEKILIIGGGGNCFSFGTHFNKNILYIDLNRIFEL